MLPAPLESQTQHSSTDVSSLLQQHNLSANDREIRARPRHADRPLFYAIRTKKSNISNSTLFNTRFCSSTSHPSNGSSSSIARYIDIVVHQVIRERRRSSLDQNLEPQSSWLLQSPQPRHSHPTKTFSRSRNSFSRLNCKEENAASHQPTRFPVFTDVNAGPNRSRQRRLQKVCANYEANPAPKRYIGPQTARQSDPTNQRIPRMVLRRRYGRSTNI